MVIRTFGVLRRASFHLATFYGRAPFTQQVACYAAPARARPPRRSI